MIQVLAKTIVDLKYLFNDDNFSFFSMGSVLGLISYTSLENFITDTLLRILATCAVAFFGGIVGVIGKEIGEKIKRDAKKWTKKKQ